MTPKPAEINQDALRAALDAYAPETVGRPDPDRLARAIATYLASLSQEGAAGVAEVVAWQRSACDHSVSRAAGERYCITCGEKIQSPTPVPDAGKGGGEVEYEPREVGGAWVALPAPDPDAARREAVGWLFLNGNDEIEFSENHPIESGESDYARDILPATADALKAELLLAWEALNEAREDLDRLRDAGRAPL